MKTAKAGKKFLEKQLLKLNKSRFKNYPELKILMN